jgi:hypothetical protein
MDSSVFKHNKAKFIQRLGNSSELSAPFSLLILPCSTNKLFGYVLTSLQRLYLAPLLETKLKDTGRIYKRFFS